MKFTPSLRAWLLDDLWLKMIALGLAIITWFYIDAELNHPPAGAGHHEPTSAARSPD